MQNNLVHMREINRITYELDALYHAAALKLGLSDSAMFILYMLYDHGGSCPLSEIHGAGMCKQTVNSAVRKLEAEGVVYLEPYKGNTKLARLTEKGRRAAESSVARLFFCEEQAFSTWTQEEIETFIALHQKYLTCLREELEGLGGGRDA